jgi:hypothetical protein
MRAVLHILALWLLIPAQSASATEYRKVTMSDGRVLIAKVMETEGLTMWVETPMGRVGIDLTQINSIDTITRGAYERQSPETVLLLPARSAPAEWSKRAEVLDELVYAHLSEMPGLEVISSSDLQARLGESSLLDCGIDLGCALALVAPMGMNMVIQTETMDSGDDIEARLFAARATSPNTYNVATVTHPTSVGLSAEVSQGIQTLLSVDSLLREVVIDDPLADLLLRDSEQGPSPAAIPEAPDPKTLARSTLVPVPGFPALLRRDLRSFGLSWGVVVPTTVGMVALVGHSTYRSPQFNILSVLSYYALTVGVNRRFGPEPQKIGSSSADAQFSSRY